MKRIVIGAVVALMLVGLSAGTSLAQQHPEVTVVQVREADEPGVWLMDIASAEAIWAIRLGDGCENIVAGPAALLIDGMREQWLVLPDATPGACHIDEANLVDPAG